MRLVNEKRSVDFGKACVFPWKKKEFDLRFEERVGIKLVWLGDVLITFFIA